MKTEKKYDEAIEAKINNSSMLTLIEEAEYVLNRFNDEFEWIINHSAEFKRSFEDTSKRMRREKLSTHSV